MEQPTVKQLREMQQRQWEEEEGKKPAAAAAAPAAQPQTVRKKSNPYINIIRKDIVCLSNIISDAGWSPIRWYKVWRMRQSGEFRDFMEHHFGRKTA